MTAAECAPASEAERQRRAPLEISLGNKGLIFFLFLRCFCFCFWDFHFVGCLVFNFSIAQRLKVKGEYIMS